MITIHPAAARYETSVPGIVTRHCFATGPHYEPDNLAFGALIGCDEHRLDPGAGFPEHAHRGVVIVSWVLEGALRHCDDHGISRVVQPGDVQVQRCGDGIRHREENASATAPLRFVQHVLLGGGDDAGSAVWPPPYRGYAGTFTVHRDGAFAGTGRIHAFAGRGEFTVGAEQLQPGDSVRSDEGLLVSGHGELLVWELDPVA